MIELLKTLDAWLAAGHPVASATIVTHERVHCPIGLDIREESPEEIAVSIVAELIAARAAQGSA